MQFEVYFHVDYRMQKVKFTARTLKAQICYRL